MMFKRFILPLLAAFSLAAPAAAKPPVWVVRDADSTIVIFGSVHMLPPGLDWRPPELTAALKAADDVWFELPLDGASSLDAANVSVQHGLLPAGQTLSQKLSWRGRKRLKTIAERLHLDMRVLDRMRPWFADVTLSVAQIASEGANRSDGVERAIAAEAPKSAEQRAFETPTEQILFFAEAPEREQVIALEATLRDLLAGKADYSGLVSIWMSGDLGPLQREALDPMRRKTPVLYRRMVTDRNARWADTIMERLAGSGETVVVVGAAHLVGKDGLPAMLRKRGATVEGP
ncbi:MAG TPA: TraB/GumN family protein [Caulobacteraceae bacterium]|nr:TraB/GumN family protein [Caulobacteraceae bacterium]